MSWSADRATIVSGLPGSGTPDYTLIPLNIEPDSDDRPSSHNHKAYSLKLAGVTDAEYLSGSSQEMHYSHMAIMRTIFRDVDGTQRITNEGLAMTLMQTVSGITGFHMFADDPTIEEIDNKHFVFTMVFHFGFDDNV